MLNVVLILHVVLIQPFGGGGIPFHFGGRGFSSGFFPFDFFTRADFFDMFNDGRYHNRRYGHHQRSRYREPRRSYEYDDYSEEEEPQEDGDCAEEHDKGARKRAKKRLKKARKKEREDARWLGKRVTTGVRLIKG